MKLKLVKHYVQNKIKDIEGEICDHQFVIDFDNPCEEELKHRQWAIKELMIDLEAYRHYLNLLNSGEAPTIEPVKHGKWLRMERCSMDGDITYSANCSVCGAEVCLWQHESYCPNCGAEMDGEVNGI